MNEKIKNSLLDIHVKRTLDYVPNIEIGFSSSLFMMFGLPTHRVMDPSGQPGMYYEKSTPLCKLTITRDKDFELPYGCYARMNQIFIDTEIKIKKSNVIDIGKTWNEYIHRIGYKEGGANKGVLEQLKNFVTCSIKITPAIEQKDRITGIQTFVTNAYDIHFDVKNPNLLNLTKGQIVISETYAQFIEKHSVPLDMDIVRAFNRNPLALDFYRYLAYRNNGLKKEFSIQEHILFDQLGVNTTSNTRVIKTRLKKILTHIKMLWDLQASFEDNTFILKPSVSAVPKKTSLISF
jgi:hypothetical protein